MSLKRSIARGWHLVVVALLVALVLAGAAVPPQPAAAAGLVAGATRISFAPGSTSANVQSFVAAGETRAYLVQASKDQTLMVSIDSPNQDVLLTVYGSQDGQSLARAANGTTRWTGPLSATQDYVIEAVASGAASSFSLQVSIPRNIRFLAGATSSSLQGNINNGEVKEYLVRALAGQTMMVNLDSPRQDVLLTVYGLQDGQPLVRSATGATDFTGQLHATQDYVIEAVRTGPATTYSLQVIIPQNIHFLPGTSTARINGRVYAHSITRYLAHAQAGQTATVSITSPGHNVFLTIYGLQDGQPLVRSVSGATIWTGRLPATQDYVIDAVSGGPASGFTLSVTIR